VFKQLTLTNQTPVTECKEQKFLFQDLDGRKVEVDFGGGYLSSDGGGLILRELERHSGLLKDFASCFIDYRAIAVLPGKPSWLGAKSMECSTVLAWPVTIGWPSNLAAAEPPPI
jgi:hypothetical protein